MVYISMGTVNYDMVPLYRRCIAAFENTNYQVILSVGNQVDAAAFGDLPEHIAVYPFVDQIAVLEKADAFVTHCGMNSVSEALYFGVPLVMLPQTAEQGAVATRTEQLGAGMKLQKTEPSEIRKAVDLILKEETYRQAAEEISRGFRACSGAKGAADKILQVCGEK